MDSVASHLDRQRLAWSMADSLKRLNRQLPLSSLAANGWTWTSGFRFG